VDAGWQPALNASRRRLLALLEDPDPRVRREATLLAADGIRHPETVEALRRRWLVEADRVTRWDLVLALGTARCWAQDGGVLRADLERLLVDDDPQLRLAAAHALAEGAPAAAAPHVDMLARAVLHDDADLWQHSAWIGGTRTTITTCTGALLRADPVAAAAYTIGVSRSGAAGQRVATMEQAGRLLAEWRTATGAVLPFLVEHLDDAEAEARYRAAALLACLGGDAATTADLLAARGDDRALRGSR
jgi:HEAT repeat protein